MLGGRADWMGRLREHRVVMHVPDGRQQHNARPAAVLLHKVPELAQDLQRHSLEDCSESEESSATL